MCAKESLVARVSGLASSLTRCVEQFLIILQRPERNSLKGRRMVCVQSTAAGFIVPGPVARQDVMVEALPSP